MKLKRFFALLLVLCMVLTMTACKKTGGAYTLVETLSEGTYALGFRHGDPTADYVEAAIKVLAASGRVAELEMKWFNGNTTDFEKDSGALQELPAPTPRTLIMGLDEDNFPMSYVSNDVYMGFDVELARAVCELLGWQLQFNQIDDESRAYVELNSGNVDVVWGGMLLDPKEELFDVRCPYMKGGCVLVVRSDSKLTNIHKMEGKIIGMNSGARYLDAVKNTELIYTAGQIQITDQGNDTVFDWLFKGQFDAIVTDAVTAKYFMR